MLRRLRGVVGTALTWAGGWGVLGAALHAVAVVLGWYGMFGVTLMSDVLGHAAIGFLGGAGFSIGLLITERRGTVLDLSVRRSAGWGALSGVVGSGIVLASLGGFGMLPSLVPVIGVAGALGALSGGGMSAVARAAIAAADDGRLLGR
jgi:hypothetical protein